MKNNIFEGAKFGDPFVTKDGRLAIYVEHNNFDDEYPHSLLVDKTFDDCMSNYDTLCFANDGSFDLRNNMHPLNIVSRYQEPITSKEIDEDKLDDIANNSLKKTQYYESTNEFEAVAYIDGYFDGYHKAFNI